MRIECKSPKTRMTGKLFKCYRRQKADMSSANCEYSHYNLHVQPECASKRIFNWFSSVITIPVWHVWWICLHLVKCFSLTNPHCSLLSWWRYTCRWCAPHSIVLCDTMCTLPNKQYTEFIEINREIAESGRKRERERVQHTWNSKQILICLSFSLIIIYQRECLMLIYVSCCASTLNLGSV